MLDIEITPRVIVNSLFILGLVLAIAYALEFAKCKVSGNKEKRRFNIMVCLWFVLVGTYLFVAIYLSQERLVSCSGFSSTFLINALPTSCCEL